MGPGVQGGVESREGGCCFLWVCFLTIGKASGKVFIRVLHLGEEASLVKCGIVFSFLPSDIYCLPVRCHRLCYALGLQQPGFRGHSQGRSSYDSENSVGLTGSGSAFALSQERFGSPSLPQFTFQVLLFF